MKAHRLYDIAFVGLKNGVHEFNYDIGDKFFADYSAPEFTDSRIKVRLVFNKESGFFLLKFEITGVVTVPCDRCGAPFPLNIWDDFDLVIKLVDNPEGTPEGEDPDVNYISRTESHINVADWIYEFINLSVPMQHIHPSGPDGSGGCDPKVLKMLDEMKGQHHQKINPIWKDLDKFRNQ